MSGRAGRPRRLSVGGVLLLTLAAASLGAYRLIGAEVGPDGVLHEPFALIPLAWIFGLAGVILLGVGFWRRPR